MSDDVQASSAKVLTDTGAHVTTTASGEHATAAAPAETVSEADVLRQCVNVVQSVMWRESAENDKFDEVGKAALAAQISSYMGAGKPIEFILLGTLHPCPYVS
jgi:hypothetical protein